MDKQEPKKFTFPKEFAKKIYDLTGNGENNKGFMLFYIDNKGEPSMIIPHNIEQSTLFSLRKSAEISLNRMDEMDIQGYLMEKTGMFDGE